MSSLARSGQLVHTGPLNSCKGEDLWVILDACDKRPVAKVVLEKITIGKFL